MAKDKNTLTNWTGVIQESAKQAAEQRKQWQEQIGEPDEILELGDYKFAFWKSKCPDGVIVAPIDKKGPNPMRMLTYEREYIEALVRTLRKIDYEQLLLKYMQEVMIEEGISFVPRNLKDSYVNFLQTELDALKSIETILEKAGKK